MQSFIVCREIISSDKELQLIAKEFVEKYLSFEKAIEFKNAYNTSDFKKADRILLDALDCVGSQGLREYSDMIQLNLTSGLKRRKKMEVLFIVLSAILIVSGIGVYYYLKHKANNLYNSISNQVSRNDSQRIIFTKQDKDLILLVKELAEVYRKTEEYLNN